jgi:hypothetical protein
MAVAVVGTIGPKLAGLARLGTVPSRPAPRTPTQPRHVIAVAIVATLTATHAASPVGARRTRLLAEVAGVAGPAFTMAGLIVADAVAGVAEGTGLLTGHPVESLWAGLIAARSREPRRAAAGACPCITRAPYTLRDGKKTGSFQRFKK